MKLALSKIKIFAAAILLVLAVPAAARACEPIPVLMFTMMSSATTVALVLHSAIALAAVVFVKSLLFARKSGLKPVSAFLYMVVANVFSTIPGVVSAAMLSVPAAMLFTAIPLFIVFVIPSNRISQLLNNKRFPSLKINFCFILASFLSAFLFMLAKELAIGVPIVYWPLKVAYATLGVAIGLGITIGYEESLISMLSRRLSKRDDNFMQSVAWANVYTALIFAFIGAAIALPQRLASPDFLILLDDIVKKLFA